MQNKKEFLSIKNISKTFGVVRALDKVDLNIFKGEIHAIVGENGAGKSTLMNIIMGITKQDEGDIYLNGIKENYHSPKEALSKGISIVFQDINLIPWLSVAENIFLGRFRSKSKEVLIRWDRLFDEAKKIIDQIGVDIDPHKLANDLSTSQKQIIQIARAISYDPKLIIMDEPTAYLSDAENKKLFGIIHQLKETGCSIIFISHKLEEVFAISDRITVLRDGKLIETIEKNNTNKEKVISLMVGRPLSKMFEEKKSMIGDTILKVENLKKDGYFHDISFALKKGEILGFYGLIGSGRTELALSIFGILPFASGRIYIEGKHVKIKSPQDAIKNGIAYLSEDRKGNSLLSNMDIKKNITISNIKKYCRSIFISEKLENIEANMFVEKLNIQTPSIFQAVMNLSGGNQQKVVLSRILSFHPKIMILDEPTHGVDVGAKKEIYSIIEKLSENGVSIIIISSELPEILGLSDRIVAMKSGTISKIFSREEADQEKLLIAASHFGIN